jgi:hypothetical protein
MLAARSLGQPADALTDARIEAASAALRMGGDEIAALATREAAVQQALAALD